MNRALLAFYGCVAGLGMMAMAGCEMGGGKTETGKMPTTKPAAVARPTIRINAGGEEVYKDAKGQEWAVDVFFDGGATMDRTDLEITGTDTPRIYQSERYSMDAYTIPVANGDYTVKLHFSEDYDGIASAQDRVFTFAVRDGDKTGKVIKEFKDFSPWGKAGAQFKAYVETVPVTVTTGKISVTFVPQVENPQINALEIIPR